MIDKDYEFAGQNDNEKVLLVVKQHGLFAFWATIKTLGLILVYVVILKFFGASTITSYATYIILIWILYIIIFNWFRWANTVYLLTDHRIICVYQYSFFRRIISESTLENILFISNRVEGLVQTFFDVGSIHIRTSGVSEEEMVLSCIKSPYEVEQEIVKAQKKLTGKTAEIAEDKKFWQAKKKEKVIR